MNGSRVQPGWELTAARSPDGQQGALAAEPRPCTHPPAHPPQHLFFGPVKEAGVIGSVVHNVSGALAGLARPLAGALAG